MCTTLQTATPFANTPKMGGVQPGHFSFKIMMPFNIKSQFWEDPNFCIPGTPTMGGRPQAPGEACKELLKAFEGFERLLEASEKLLTGFYKLYWKSIAGY